MRLEDPSVVEQAAKIIEKISGSPISGDVAAYVSHTLLDKKVLSAFRDRWPNPLWRSNIHGQKNLSMKKSVLDMRFPGPEPSRSVYYETPATEDFESTLHIGQLKLMLQLLYFVVHYARRDSDLLVYAGAAAGTNIGYVARLFPHVHFVLYDPAHFDSRLKKVPNIELHNDLFLLEEAKKWAKEDPLFVSDIRRSMTRRQTKDNVTINEDMDMQKEWAMIMPRESMLKFRLNWNEGETEYLAPIELLFQAFPGQMSTELRLITSAKSGLHRYDRKFFEETIFHFNNRIRTNWYDHDIVYPGVDHCFDCASMIFIFEEVFRWHGGKSDTDRKSCVLAMIHFAEQYLGKKFRNLNAENTSFQRHGKKNSNYKKDGIQD